MAHTLEKAVWACVSMQHSRLLCGLSNEEVSTMNITEIVRTLTPLADALEFYTIPYHLIGSLATSVYVKTHVVQGIEVVADIKFSQVPALVAQLEKTYDVKELPTVLKNVGEYRQRGAKGV
jgi:hypothetical protein